MKRLSLQIKLLSFFVLMNVGAVQGMESPSQGRIKNIKDVCKQSVSDMKMFNLLDDLWSLPTIYAINAMRSMDSNWIAKDGNRVLLIELVKSNILDSHVACAVVEKLDDLALACQLAQQGEITPGVVSLIVDDFLQMEVTTCLNYFYSLFHMPDLQMFPEKILGYGNHDILYSALINAMTQNYSFVVGDITNYLFSMRDFNISMSFKKGSNSPIVYSGENFLVTCRNKHCIRIINLETKISLDIVVPVDEVAQLVFKKDNVTSLGILDTNGKIHEFAMPLALLRAEIPLQQLAALVYCKAQIYKKTMKSIDCMGHTIFESQNCGEETKLIKFIQEKLQGEWIPSLLRDTLNKDIENLRDVAVLRSIFIYMAQTLDVTREQVAMDLYVHYKDIAWTALRKKHRDWETNFLVETFGSTFKQLYWFKEQ